MAELSVVIPCYNAERYLGEAIESALGQTRRPLEVLVVDDCSTDSSAEVARRAGARYIRTPTNAGPAHARNLGAREARGDYLAWLDADDRWAPRHCEAVGGLLDRFPEAAVAFGIVAFFGAREGVWQAPAYVPQRTPFDAFWINFRNPLIPQMSAIVRRDRFEAVGGYLTGLERAEDYDLWVRLSRRHPFVYNPEVTSHYRWHESQRSGQPLRQLRSMYATRRRVWERARDAGDAAFAAEVANELARIWTRDLREAWYGRRMDELRFVLALEPILPVAPAGERERWTWRKRIPGTLLRAFDRARDGGKSEPSPAGAAS